MKRLTHLDARAVAESQRALGSLVELSEADLARVAGAGCWMEAVGAYGTGWYYHSPYPPGT